MYLWQGVGRYYPVMTEEQRIKELRQRLNYCNYRYYIENDPVVSDFEFDTMLRELQDLEAAHPELADPNSPTVRVGSDVSAEFRQVAHKQRGSGLLPYPERIASFLDRVLPASPLALSVKIRLGYRSAREIYPVMEVLNSYPLKYVAIHPRIGVQLYGGQADWDGLESILPLMKHPCVYSGDIDSVGRAECFRRRFPGIREIMLGRGVIADPFLPCRLAGISFSAEDEKLLFRCFVRALLRQYRRAGLPEQTVLQRQKLFWSKFAGTFVPEGAFEQIKRLSSVQEYVRVCGALLGCDLESAIDEIPKT